jgi:TolA-binding protein
VSYKSFTKGVRSALLLACAAVPAFGLTLPVDTAGTGGFISGNFRATMQVLSGDTAIADSAVFEFKQGMVHFLLKDYDAAEEHFRKCDRPSPLRPCALELIGDIETVQKRPSEAAHAWLSAHKDSTLPARASSAIQDKLLTLVKGNPLLVAPYPELGGLAAAHRALEGGGTDSMSVLIDSLFAQRQYPLLDSLLTADLDSMEADEKCSLAARVAALSDSGDSCIGTARLFNLSRAAYGCKRNPVAESLLVRCEKRKDFAKTGDTKQYLLLKGMLSYNFSKYPEAIKYLSSFVKKAGPTPEAIMTLGRANRSISNDSAADSWYSRFAVLYPKHANAQDVLWYLAWEQEEKGHYQKAVQLYRQVYAVKKNGVRSDEACFRTALCQFKDRKYSLACSTLASFLQSGGDSPFANGALYWKAKCLSAVGNQSEAEAAFRRVVRQAPTDYYSYRAREMLVLSGDTAKLPELDTSYNQSRTREWLDSVSGEKKPLSSMDSMQFVRGTLFALCGMPQRAELFLDGLETRYPANLALQFDLASLYKFVNSPVLSYKAGRRLGWRVPAPSRATMPRPLFDIVYPRPFFDIVSREAGKNGLDPFLVLAVMRQESIFDPSVVSRAGAVGLMQLMPATSQTICKELGEPYYTDSLYHPSVNIRQGSFYIKRLLDQFGGNQVLAIASYNGGPNKASEWFAKNKRTTFDLFIEDIGFTETRGYVKKVLANFWTYRWFAAKALEK